MNPNLVPPPSYTVYPTASTAPAPGSEAFQTGYQGQGSFSGVAVPPYSEVPPYPQQDYGYAHPDSHVTLEIGSSSPYSQYSQPGYQTSGQEPLSSSTTTGIPEFLTPRSIPLSSEHTLFFSRPHYEVTDDDKLWSLLAYILSPVIPLVIFFLSNKRLRPFIKSHYAQAFVLGFFNLILWGVLSWFFLLALIPFCLWLGLVFLGVMAYSGNEIRLPLLTPALQSLGFA